MVLIAADMAIHSRVANLSPAERLNFLLTNRIPRRWLTQFMGRFSRIEHPLVRDISMTLWQAFGGKLDLSDAKKRSFTSVHDCFTRELKAGARPVCQDPQIVTSPCDAQVGAHGDIRGVEVLQAKGFPYSLEELLGSRRLVEKYRDGRYVTLRLTSRMYHHFHAPCDCRITEVNYISGDTWNVNPIALKRIEQLFCKNERAVLDLDTGFPQGGILLVPVAAVLVASMKFRFLDEDLSLEYRGPNHIPCDASFSKGEELGYFQHGSTIIAFATADFGFCENWAEGQEIRMGQPLLKYRETES